MRSLDAGRQVGVQPGPVHVGAHVGQDRAADPEPVRPAHDQAEIGMRRMGRALEAVDQPDPGAGQDRQRRVVEFHHVGRIAEVADAEAQRGAAAVHLLEQEETVAGDLDRGAGAHRAGQHHRPVEAGRRPGAERVAEPGLDLRQHRFGAERLDRPVDDAVQAAHLVQAGDVVGMGMGIEDGVDPADAGGQELGAQVGRGVHQHPIALRALDHDRRAAAPVARLPRVAHAPVAPPVRAAQHRHAGGAAAAQDDDAHRG